MLLSPGPQTVRLLFDKPQRAETYLASFRGNRRPNARKSSSCGGLRTPAILSEKSCVSSGISARPRQNARPRTTPVELLDVMVLELKDCA